MKVRIAFFMLVLALPRLAWSQAATRSYSLTDRSANSLSTDGAGDLNVGYARIVADSGSTTPSGVAIFGFRTNNVLVAEAGVPASPLLRTGRIYAEVNGGLDIGLAIANPNSTAATVTFSFTKFDGTDFGSGSRTIPAGGQVAEFLDQAPYNGGTGIQGTFSFSSNVPISVVALQGFTNERGDFLITTLPVIDTSVAAGTSSVLLPHFADGGGWTTSVILVNPTDTAMTGTIQFRNGAGAASPLTANGQSSASFSYSLPRRGSFKLTTSGAGANTSSGSVSIAPSSGSSTPVPLVVFSYKPGSVTVTQAGVPTNLGTAFRVYAEGSSSIQTGIAVANGSSSQATVTFEAFNASGASTGLTNSITVAGQGQTAKFLNELFPNLTLPFTGLVRITTTSSGISVVGLRTRTNERGDFLITTTPPSNEATAASTAEFDFPHIVNGGGYTTQFVLYSGSSGQSASGSLRFFKQNASTLSLTLTSNVAVQPLVLTSVSPSSQNRGSAITLAGSGFDSTFANNTVVFTSANGTVNATPSAGSSTSLTVTVPSAAISGPVFVQTGGQSSSSKILQVTSTGALVQSTVTVTGGATTANADIYVAPAVAGLSVTRIGIVELAATEIAFNVSSGDLPRGTSKLMGIVGTGLGSAAGTTVSVSGGGVTVSNYVFQDNFVLVKVTVDATAALGPRNVIVTNSNLDTSILTGGVFIR